MSTLLAPSVLADTSRSSTARAADSIGATAPRAPYRYAPNWKHAIVAGDVLAIVAAFVMGFSAAWLWAGAHPSFGGCAVVAVLLFGWLGYNGTYSRTLGLVPRDELYYAIAYVGIAAIVLLPVLALLGITPRSYAAISAGVGLSALFVGTIRFVMRAIVPPSALFVAQLHASTGDTGERAQHRNNRPAEIAVAEHIGRLRSRARTLGEQTVLAVELPSLLSSSARVAKRAFDIILASIALCVFAPIIALAAAAIVLESGFPILYSQERLGERGRTFRIVKLRSMYQDAEDRSGPVWAVPSDLRVTRVGRILRRTSIDELPQLLNVLRGDMSIVGPRPERPSFVERFAGTYPRYIERLLVAPGITACSHLYMPRAVSDRAISQRLEYDLYYIRNWSIAMDIATVIKTAVEVAFHRAP